MGGPPNYLLLRGLVGHNPAIRHFLDARDPFEK